MTAKVHCIKLGKMDDFAGRKVKLLVRVHKDYPGIVVIVHKCSMFLSNASILYPIPTGIRKMIQLLFI